MQHKLYSLILAFLFSSIGLNAADSMLASGQWYKVGVTETGIQKLTYNDLSSLGIDVDRINPKNIRVFHNGGGVLNELNAQPRFNDLMELPIFVAGEGDGRFDHDDYVLFYARGPVTWRLNQVKNEFVHVNNAYDNYSYAFITVDRGEGLRIQEASAPTGAADEDIDEFLDYQVYDDDNYNIIDGGRTYYADIIDGPGSLTKNFTFTNLKNELPCSVEVNLAGRNFQPASFQLYVNDVLLQTFMIKTTSAGSQSTFAYEASGGVVSTIAGNTVKVTLTHTGTSGTTSIGYIDYIEVTAWRALTSPDMRCFSAIPMPTTLPGPTNTY